jgi:hypothetical protein
MGNITSAIARKEGLGPAEVDELERMFEEIAASNKSMPPEIWPVATSVKIDTSYGGQTIDGALLSESGLKELGQLSKKHFASTPKSKTRKKLQDKIYSILDPYLEFGSKAELYSIDLSSGGWMARLSMPGYMDATEPSWHATLSEAIRDLHSMYADADVDDYEE